MMLGLGAFLTIEIFRAMVGLLGSQVLRGLRLANKRQIQAEPTDQPEDHIIHHENYEPPILKVLRIDLCARAILDYLPISDLVRTERVSREWQTTVHTYLQHSRDLSFCDVNFLDLDELKRSDDQTAFSIHRMIPLRCHPMSLACKTIWKFGFYISKLITERHDEEYFQFIAANCPNLRQIEIIVTDEFNSQLKLIKQYKHIEKMTLNFQDVCLFGMYPASDSDRALCSLFKTTDCNNIEISYCESLSGSCIQSMKTNSLKSLKLSDCVPVCVSELLTGIHALQGLTCLALDSLNPAVLDNVHLLLQKMPRLQQLSLKDYSCCRWGVPGELKVELIAAVGQLVDLRVLDLRHNMLVADALLEAVAFGCRKLERLDISGCRIRKLSRGSKPSRLTVRGVAALCRRSPSACTTLHFGVMSSVVYNIRFTETLATSVVIRELEAQCCVKLTPEWVQAACRNSYGRKAPLELKSGCIPVEAQDPKQKLKILLHTDLNRLF